MLFAVACGGSAATSAPTSAATAAPQTAAPVTGAPASAGPTGATGCTSEATEGEEVVIADFEFTPAQLEVAAGTAVGWTNNDSAAHTVTFDGGPDCGRMDEGDSVALDFDTPGTYQYVCAFHPDMQGSIVVE
jgi:plastocyanin